MKRKKNLKGLRACHAMEVSNKILETLEASSEDVSEVQEMTLLLLTEIMFNTALMVDISVDDDSNERGAHDNKRDKQNDGRTS